MKTGPSLAKALRLAKAARGGRLKDREGVAKPSPHWNLLVESFLVGFLP